MTHVSLHGAFQSTALLSIPQLGDTLSLGAGVVGTARVAGLGAHVGLGEAGDTSLGVADGNTKSADGAAVDTSSRAGAADAGSNRRRGAARHRESTAAVVVDVTREGGSTDSADVAHVSTAWEDRAREGSKGRTSGVGGRSTYAAAVTSRNKAGSNGKANRAASALVDVVGVAALDRGESCGHGINHAHFELRGSEPNLCGELLGMGGTVCQCLQDELVGHNINIVRSNARPGGGGVESTRLVNIDVVKRQLGLFKLGEAVGQDDRSGTSSSHFSGQGLVSDTDIDGVSIIGNPSTGELSTHGVAKLVNDFGSLDLPGDTSSSLLGIQAQVPLHGS
ncbi:unnamed protein product [Clonostachys chloroleuca]|uniref:Uncharacterized protein n=1 Tax=Clonostachys chloroleuca TaxID=1926264 RepID=A0AA35PTY1_9HYPO|nr:unnamed protein product [Clonostachys chloroleuca]